MKALSPVFAGPRVAFAAPWILMLALTTAACGGDDKTGDKPGDGAGDTASADTAPADAAPGDSAPDSSSPDSGPQPPEAGPADAPAPDTAPPGKGPGEANNIEELRTDKTLKAPGLKDDVIVVMDDWGIPHIYAKNLSDLGFAGGWVQASLRMFAMEGVRRLSSGTLTEFQGAGALGTDVDQRFWKLRRIAQQVYDSLPADDELKLYMDSYAAGVNAFLKQAQWEEIGPEFIGLGIRPENVAPWTPADSLAFARYQVLNLSEGYIDEGDFAAQIEAARKAFPKGDAREGAAADLLTLKPARAATILDGYPKGDTRAQVGPKPHELRLEHFRKHFPNPRFRPGLLEGHASFRKSLAGSPYNIFGLYTERDRGSNNWVVSGKHTASGKPIVSGDPHLGLNNPAIFMEMHLNTKRAGGTYNAAGVTFPGIAAVVIGHNDAMASSVTTFFTDVTDYYVEKVAMGPDGFVKSVLFKGQQVDVVRRPEEFRFKKEEKETCEQTAGKRVPGWAKKIYPVKSREDGPNCVVTIEYLEVPHHGPINSVSDDKTTALSVRWTGFQPTNESKAMWLAFNSKNQQEFEDALDNFGVGAQGFVYGDTKGDIFMTGTALTPIREKLDPATPPWLPLPGDGGYEWTGKFLDDTQLPHALNPAKGYVVTANNDPVGNTLDGDPLNETLKDGKPYYGYFYAEGYRGGRIQDRIEEYIKQGKKITVEDMMSVQADHYSNMGKDWLPLLTEVLEKARKAREGDKTMDPKLAEFYDERAGKAMEYLKKWRLWAASGVGKDVPAEEVDDSIATSIFNAWYQWIAVNTLGDEQEKMGRNLISFQVFKALHHITFREGELISKSGADGHSIYFDDLRTPDVESRDFILMKSLKQALDFLESGPAFKEGFGTKDMTQWRWGAKHTLTLKHLAGLDFLAVPPGGDAGFPNGFPRHGDNNNVDACNYGVSRTSFSKNWTYSSGPATRVVVELTDKGPKGHMAIPGGQDGKLGAPHYDDQIRKLWRLNKYHKIYFEETDVIRNSKQKWVFTK
ncbi:MAG: hypothetical protein GMKNLPBB_01062 [Myxococcota bacterium]|nr:hypothetical protein [Myxococcota bacterium]